jgi:hypothetical protein
MRTLTLVALGSFLLACPRSAAACASCACGDPTLTAMGTSKPFAGRLRLGAEAQLRWLSSGVRGVSRIEAAEQRLALVSSWAPLDRLFLQARVPLVRRDVELPDFTRVRAFHVGDVELGGKWFFYQDRDFAPRFLLALDGGLELPTAPRLEDAGGAPLPFEAQLGTGSLDPSVGLSAAWFLGPLSIFASARGLFPTAGRFDGARAGTAALSTLVLQRAVGPELALRAGADVRYEAPFVVGGEADPHSGGGALFFTPEVLWSGVTDLVVRVSVSVPAWLELRGTQTEGPTVRLGVVIDV